MTEALMFTVHGTPRPKSRPRWVKGRMVTTANPHEKLWRKAVERAALAAVLYRGDPAPVFRGPVRVTMIFTFEPPASARDRIGTPHTDKPDKDNLEKLVLDAMKKAAVFRDDSQVADGPVSKVWGERAGVVVIAEPMPAAPAPTPSAAEPVAPSWLAPSS
jgi:Holliday junction resolvase RusA-like endonuclease